MTKNLQTKSRILNLLKKRKMTITEISQDLGISKSTASQHMSELARMNLVEQEFNPHFKKVKYYKATGSSSSASNQEYGKISRAIVGISIVAALGAALIFLALVGSAAHYHVRTNTTTENAGIRGNALSCPVMLIYNNPNTSVIYHIVNGIADGDPCQMAYINGNTSSFTQALGGLKYISDNGTVYVPSARFNYTLSSTQVTDLEASVDNGYCYDLKALQFFGIKFSIPSGTSCKASIYS
ncbi:MAG: winged helix-turn-helix domain-containing protein [Candidatus Micrarchaeaceae archaeon]